MRQSPADSKCKWQVPLGALTTSLISTTVDKRSIRRGLDKHFWSKGLSKEMPVSSRVFSVACLGKADVMLCTSRVSARVKEWICAFMARDLSEGSNGSNFGQLGTEDAPFETCVPRPLLVNLAVMSKWVSANQLATIVSPITNSSQLQTCLCKVEHDCRNAFLLSMSSAKQAYIVPIVSSGRIRRVGSTAPAQVTSVSQVAP
eukprot:scaffold226026_cov19-Tisochrysis_lutea.AAC.2